MKRILFIHHSVGWGGAPINMINIIRSLDPQSYKVKVLLLKDSVVSSKLRQNNIDYVIAKSKFYKHFYRYYSHTVTGEARWYQFFKICKLTICWLLSRYYFAERELEKLQADIIHLNSSVLTDWLAPSSKSGKVVYHVQEIVSRGTFGLRYNFFRKQIKKHAHKIVAISKHAAQCLDLPEITEIIYNYAEIPDKLPVEDSYSSKKILYLGGASYIKGFYTLVNALDYLNEDIIVWFGGGYEIELRSIWSFKSVLKTVFQIGKKKRKAIEKIKNHPNAIEIGLIDNVSDYLHEVCCLVSPFTISHFARPIIEAHLHKKPVICTDVEGMNEIVEHEKNGLFVARNNPVELADAIKMLTSDYRKSKSFGEAGYISAIQNFTPDNIHQLQSLYSRLFIA